MAREPKKEIILGVTASIAIYKSCEIIRRLKQEGLSVTVVMTEEAEGLIRPIVFSSLSGNRVYRDMFDSPVDYEIEHISLADKADLVLIAPATANIIAKIAGGICDDLLSCVVCATKAPVVIAPAMNENMYQHKITQGNIEKLKDLGYKIIGPVRGRLADGRIGLGHLASVEDISKAVKKGLKMAA